VPFKAFDAAIDAIASLPALKECCPRLPLADPPVPRAQARRVSLTEAAHEVPVDRPRIRRRAFAALREL